MRTTSEGYAFKKLIADLLPRYGAGEAQSIARIVFEDVFKTRTPVSFQLPQSEEVNFEKIRVRLLSGEPLQYVLGQADFFGMKFKVNPAVLIPRQETEELVAWALDWLKTYPRQKPVVLDIGLGSGCIGISLKAKYPDLKLFGLEKSEKALSVATENAENLLGAGNFFFKQTDILDRENWVAYDDHIDVIVSNPPYIPLREKNIMPEHVLAHEPELALFVDDADPLTFYRTIAEFAIEKLVPGGALFFECNEFNAQAVADLIQNSGFKSVELRKDLAGADRMISGIIDKDSN